MQPLLGDLCAGVDGNELPAALGGLLAASAHVRAAALAALPSVPALAAGECPQDGSIATVLWLARFDAHPGVQPAEFLPACSLHSEMPAMPVRKLLHLIARGQSSHQ